MIHLIPIDEAINDRIEEFNKRFAGTNKKLRMQVHPEYLFVTVEDYSDDDLQTFRGLSPNLLTDHLKRGAK